MHPPDNLPALASALVAYGLGLGGGLFVLGFATSWKRRHRRRAEEAAEASASAGARPRPGRVCVAGTVVPLEEGERSPVRVSIRQKGREYRRKGRWYSRWTEEARHTDARPFLIETKGGLKLRVEATDQVLLVDRLTEIIRDERDVRRRVASLDAGERVFVTGYLEEGSGSDIGPYRSSGGLPRIVAPPGGRLLVSTEPLTARHKRREKAHRVVFWVGVAYFLVAQLALASYYQLQLTGDHVTATVVDRWSYEKYHRTKRGGYWKTHYAIAAETPAGVLHTDMDEDDCDQRPETVPMVVCSPRTYVLGERASLASGRATLVLVMAALFAIIAPISVVHSRDWWDKKLSERVSGRLDES